MRITKRLAPLLFVLGTVAPVVGCGSTSAEGPPATAESAMTRAPVATNAHGMVRWMGGAFADVPLRDDQRKQIEELAQQAEARHTATAQAHKAAAEELATEIERGSLDRAAFSAKIDAAVAAAEAARPADRAALEKLHAILDASQRAAFVDALEKRGHEKMEGHKPHERMAEWATDLKITDAQRDQIKDALKAELEKNHGEGMREMRAHHEKAKKTFEAFREDKFVVDEVAPVEDLRSHAKEGGEKIMSLVAAVLPILTPEQRSIAAKKIRERAEDGPEGVVPVP